MKVHMHTKFCFICLFTFIFHHCNHCHGYAHDHTPEESHTHRHNDYQISQEPYFPTSKSSPPDAELEQRYYIEKLFHHYGDNGRLSYSGLEKLLSSLGLGEVKVVEIGHEDVGHDHDSHSDTLHVRDPVDSNHHTEEKNDSKTVSECKEKKASVSPEHKSTHKNHSHHPHHHHHHVHNGTHHNHSHHNHTVNHVSLEGQTNDPLPGTNATQEQVVEKKMHKHKKRRKGTKTSEAALNSQSDLEQTQDENKHGYKHDHNSASSLNPVNVDHDNHEWEEPRQGVEALQRNTRKREAPNDHTSMKTHVGLERSHGQHVHEVHEHNECLNVTQLLSYFGLNMNSPISPEQFTYICPALLYQIDRRFCIKHFTGLQMETVEESKAGASAWVCGLISITVISLLSLLGVILIPFINQGCFKFLLNFFVALAVGTLSGDALLHLLPHSQGGHDHSSDEHGHSHDHGKDLDEASSKEFLVEYDSVMKGLVALGGIYLLFIVEHCLRMFKHYKERRGRPSRLKRKAEEAAVGRKLSDHKLNRRSDAEWLQLKPLAAPEDPASSESQQLNETEMTYVDSLNQSPMKVFVASEDTMPHINKDGSCDDDHSADDGHFDNNHAKVEMPKKHSHSKHSHHSHGHCHSGKDLKDTGIASIAWMVIMGDGMHNFSDGLAIGAAFSTGFTGGISTSVAVFCHELPHELGDFAVLLKAGMTVNQAIVYNLLSAMMAYIGMLIGTAVGQYADNITLWIFAITAGMFLYVALVDMLPEMLHGDGENEDGYCNFILQNLGLLLGFAIMLVIALYEDKIVFDIQL